MVSGNNKVIEINNKLLHYSSFYCWHKPNDYVAKLHAAFHEYVNVSHFITNASIIHYILMCKYIIDLRGQTNTSTVIEYINQLINESRMLFLQGVIASGLSTHKKHFYTM